MKRLLVGCLIAQTLWGCGDEIVTTQPESDFRENLPVVVEDGKEDDFFSASAQEYMVEGYSSITLEDDYADAGEADRMRRVRELIPLQQVVIAWFFNQYLQGDSSNDSNDGYGGFEALTKNGSWEDLQIEQVDRGLTYRFLFRQEIGGQLDLLDEMGLTLDSDGRAQLTLTIGILSNEEMARLETNNEWYRSSPWSNFNPESVDSSRLTQIALTIWPEHRSNDAWFDTEALFGDGVVTIDVFFGWDYHNNYHIVHSERIYDWLIGMGFTSPVGSYDDLTHESGPLVRTMMAGEREVRAEVRLFWGKPHTATDPDTDAGGRLLEDLMRDSFLNREVIVFTGHSGAFYGFALANWKRTSEGDLDDSEIPSLDMPSDTYQIVLANGCQTYGLGQAFFMNHNKPGRANLDVITTTNFSGSSAETVEDFLRAIIGTNEQEEHVAVRIRSLLRDLDLNARTHTMYGIHGIDDNPQVHPYMSFETICQPCMRNADCVSQGMQCTLLNDYDAVCTAECVADAGCPEGYECVNTAIHSWLEDRQCVPANPERSCQSIDTEPSGPTVLINEVLADPAQDVANGDANGDGVRSARDDEFVELRNLGNQTVDLSEWTLSDGVRVRFAFPENTSLPAGKALVVFGGGSPSSFGEIGGAQVFVASTLGLSDESDVVVLADATGEVVDRVQWGIDGCANVSLVREDLTDPASGLVFHPHDRSHTAGLDNNGNPF